MAGSRSKEEDARAAWKEELRQAQQGAAAAAGEDSAARGGLAAADNDDDAIDVAPFFNRAFECLRPGNQLQSYYRYRGGRGRGEGGGQSANVGHGRRAVSDDGGRGRHGAIDLCGSKFADLMAVLRAKLDRTRLEVRSQDRHGLRGALCA